VVFYPGLHFEGEKRRPNFRKTRSPIVENPASVKNGYLRTGSIYGQALISVAMTFGRLLARVGGFRLFFFRAVIRFIFPQGYPLHAF
jgi:hypothetical protein